MPYSIEWSTHARRSLRALAVDARERIALAVDGLSADPRPQGVRMLRGRAATYRLRVGEYRVLYEVTDAALLVWVVDVGHRKSVYKGR